MINPQQITDYGRTTAQLEEFILFAICVAGKPANRTARQVNNFLGKNDHRPFAYIRDLIKAGRLDAELKRARLGQYSRLNKAFSGVVALCPQTCTVAELEAVHGIGPKTARFYVLHSRQGTEVAVLDRHILRWMREVMGLSTPKATPTGSKYRQLEEAFIKEAKRRQRDLADLDLEIWRHYAEGPQPGSTVGAQPHNRS